MKTIITAILLVYSFGVTHAQRNPLEVFKPLIGKVWKASGEWGDGNKFIQESTFDFSLEGNLVTVESNGYIDQQQTKVGHRNHGIRMFDSGTGNIKFWEFDIFGSVTEGNVVFKGKNIFYQYSYGGNSITDMWEYVDENTYIFRIGVYESGEWEQVFLLTEFKAL